MLLVDVPDPFQQFNVVVHDGAGRYIWQQEGLSAGYLDAVAVGIPGYVIPPGNYSLIIESAGAGPDFRQEFRFASVTSE